MKVLIKARKEHLRVVRANIQFCHIIWSSSSPEVSLNCDRRSVNNTAAAARSTTFSITGGCEKQNESSNLIRTTNQN
jgi:hypothetical protein